MDSSPEIETTDQPDRKTLMLLAVVIEGGLVVVALFAGWWLSINPFEQMVWNPKVGLYGLLATFPLLASFAISYKVPFEPLQRIKHLLIEMFGPWLRTCRWYDIIILAALAGFCEEFFFRGVLQPWLSRWGGYWTGFVLTAVIFGICHMVTPIYAILAALASAYLSWLAILEPTPSLITPMIAHGLYDWAAFTVIVRAVRDSPEPTPDEQTVG
ncbi:MAG: CPBP family intramembrane metalloprotease [Planctomycetaceae bacterium]|nr:CPBP family intramembrane metalloprotease [Planctomycetaceae bacterium]